MPSIAPNSIANDHSLAGGFFLDFFRLILTVLEKAGNYTGKTDLFQSADFLFL